MARGPRGWRRGQIINGIGATATGLVLVTVVVSKFTTGAWIPAIVVPAVVLLFRAIHRHYQHVGRQLRIPDDWQQVERVHIVMLLVGGVQRGLLEALAYTPALLPDRLVAVYVASDEAGAEKVRRRWARARTGVDVTVVIDHYRELYEPVMKVINEVDDHDELSHLTVVVPEFTTPLVGGAAAQPVGVAARGRAGAAAEHGHHLGTASTSRPRHGTMTASRSCAPVHVGGPPCEPAPELLRPVPPCSNVSQAGAPATVRSRARAAM